MAKKKNKDDVINTAIDIKSILEDLDCRVFEDISQEQDGVVLKTGLFSLDLILSGAEGLTSGISEIFGPPAAGKTHVALSILEQAQKSGLHCFYVNQERGVNKSTLKCFPGIDTAKTIIIEPDHGQAAINAIEAIIKNCRQSFVVLDSIPACISSAQIDAKAEDNFMAVISRLMSGFMPKAKTLTKQNDCHVLLINQCRDNLRSMAGGKLTPGGWAIKYNCDWRIELSVPFKDGYIDRGGQTIGQWVKAEIVKSRHGRPFQTATFPLIYGHGFDPCLELVELGLQFGQIKRSGSWYIVLDQEQKQQGAMATAEYIRSEPKLQEQIKDEIRKLFI